MRDATECAPKTCPVCHKRLTQPKYEYPFLNNRLTEKFGFPWVDSTAPIQHKSWLIQCNSCKTLYIWSHHTKSNGCWKIRSDDPLFDTQQIVSIA